MCSPADYCAGGSCCAKPAALGKCAEAAALRKAFPRELGGVYITEEMYGVRPAGDPASPPPGSRPRDDSPFLSDSGAKVHIPMDPPASRPPTNPAIENVLDRTSFDMALVELFDLKEPERRRVLSVAHAKFRNYQIPEDEFFRQAIKDVVKNPRAYSLNPPSAAAA